MGRVGIIGYGSFGRFLTNLLSPHAEVLVMDAKNIVSLPKGVRTAHIDEISNLPLVVIATGLDGIEPVCKQLANYVKPDTIVIDTCSVKAIPQALLRQILGNKCRIIATHPLFGPQSFKKNSTNLSMVICSDSNTLPVELSDLFEKRLGIKLIFMSADSHDREMAWVHGLTFFVGRALMEINPPESQLTTHYYQKLHDLIDIEKQHSQELFMTIQRGNKYTGEIRQQLVTSLTKLEQLI